MAAADSNVVLRLLVQDDDPQYAAALAFLRSSGRLFVSHVVLAEVIWGLLSVYEFPKPRVVAAIERLLDIDEIDLEDTSIVEIALSNYRASNADFSDCLILGIAASRNELPLATFDVKLGKLEGTRRLGGRARTR